MQSKAAEYQNVMLLKREYTTENIAKRAWQS